MCGIFGWNVKNPDRKTKLKLQTIAITLAYANDFRGGDSWGVFARYNKSQNPIDKIWKNVGAFYSKGSRAIHKVVGSNVLLAHTRKATEGSVTKNNAHPFHCGRVIGAHNGIIWNHDDLNKKFNRNCEVDSEHIFWHIDQKLDKRSIMGYGAIEYVYHDDKKENGNVYLGILNNGELSVAKVDGVGLFWSSTQFDLEHALNVVEFDYTEYKVKNDRLYRATSFELYESGILDYSTYSSKGSYRTNQYGHMVQSGSDVRVGYTNTGITSSNSITLREDIIDRLGGDPATSEILDGSYARCKSCNRTVNSKLFCDDCGFCNIEADISSCCFCKKDWAKTTYRVCYTCKKTKTSDLVHSLCWKCKETCCDCNKPTEITQGINAS